MWKEAQKRDSMCSHHLGLEPQLLGSERKQHRTQAMQVLTCLIDVQPFFPPVSVCLSWP